MIRTIHVTRCILLVRFPTIKKYFLWAKHISNKIMITSSKTTENSIFRSEKPLFATAVQSSFFVLIAKILRYGFVFLSQLILMNFLNPADFGRMRYITVILGVVCLVNEAGLSVALVQKKHLSPNEIASSISLVFFLSWTLYGALFFLAPSVASFFNNNSLIPLIKVGGLSAPLGGISIVQRSLMQRRFQYGRLSVIESISALAGSIIGIIMGILGHGVWSLVFSVLVHNSFSSLLSIVSTGKIHGNFFTVRSSMTLWVFGFGTVLYRLISYASTTIDHIVVGKQFGEQSLGMYSLAFTIITLPPLALGTILANVALTAFSRFQDDSNRIRVAFLRLTKTVTTLSVPFYAIVFCLAPELMQAIAFVNHSQKWLPAAPYIKILAPLGLLHVLGSYPNIVWTAQGKNSLRILWVTFSLITMVIATVIGSFFSVRVVCYALLIRGIALFPIGIYLNYKTFALHPKEYVRSIIPSLCCGLVMIGCLWGFQGIIQNSDRHVYARIILECIGGFGIYGAMLAVISPETYKDLRLALRGLLG
jgi:teichuronic acid exporter